MVTYSWTNTSGGSWTTTGNWSSNIVPTGSADVALINVNAASPYDISFNGSGALGGLEMSDSNATLSFVTNTVSITSFVTLAAGTIAISGGGIANHLSSSTLTISGGTLNLSAGQASFGTGGINMTSGVADLTGGSFITTGALNISGGTFTLAGAAASATDGATFSGATVSFNAGTLSSTNGQDQVLSGQLITMAGGAISSTGSSIGGILNSGTIQGYGSLITGTGGSFNNDVEGTGKIIASGGTLSVTAAGAGVTATAPVFSISDNSTLQFGGPVGSKVSVSFSGKTAEVLNLTSAAAANNFLGTVSNFVGGDTIVVAGAQSSKMGSSTVLDVYSGLNQTGSLLAAITFSSAPANIIENGTTFTVCFAAGSRIRTEQGEVAVEQLVEGQRVAVLRNGNIEFTPITWIGERRINLALHPHPQTAAPVRVCRGAIGDNLPSRDLLLSPDHCLFLDGKLIPAKSLINGMTIVQERSLQTVHYFHVEVEPHAVLLAEGLPVESYLDTGNRAYFQNCGTALVLHPEFTVNAGLKAWETHACAPLTVQPELVRPIWQRLADRAESLGFVAPQPETTLDADLHLLADGRTIRPMAARDGRYVFALPGNCDAVRLVSRATIPSDLSAYLDDWRPLGVAVARVVVRTQAGQAIIPADHPSLSRGWHTVESDGTTTWRWTNGDAELAIEATDAPAVLEVHVCNTARYIVEETPRQLLAA